jgi:hypothetical protein
MEVHLGFTARSQFDRGGELRQLVLLARHILERDGDPPGAVRLSPEQIRAYTEPEDDDLEVEDMTQDEIWLFEIEGRKILFAPIETDEGEEPARQLIQIIEASAI